MMDEAEPYEWHGRVLQDGLVVAGVTARDRRTMLRELSHYAAVYAQDGAVALETRAGKNRWRKHVQ